MVNYVVTNVLTNEVGWAHAQVLATDGDFGPSRTLLGRDARDQRGLVGTRHGGLRQTGIVELISNWKKTKWREA